MSAPASLPVWATDNTNNAAPSSGQKNSGWVLDQFIVSSYMNYWMNLVYQWILYLSSNASVGWHDRLPSGSLTGFTWSGTAYNTLSNVAGNIDLIPIFPRVGDVITDIRANTLTSNQISGFVITLKLFKVLNGAGSTLATVNMPTSGSWATTSGSLGSPETVVDGASYYIKLDVPSNMLQTSVDSVGYKTGS